MRIWTFHPEYLDQRGLVALWRESLLAQKVLMGLTRGYMSHPQLIRFLAHADPVGAIGVYLMAVLEESVTRDYRFDRSKIISVSPVDQIPETKGQLLYEWRHFMSKLAVRDRERQGKLVRLKEPKPNPLFRMIDGGIRSWESGKEERLSYHAGRTRFGDFAVVWAVHGGSPAVSRVVLSRPGIPARNIIRNHYPDIRPGTCGEIESLAGRISLFAGGMALDFDLDSVRMDWCPEFQQRVLRAEHGIPYGSISTYGRIAAHLGRPGAARAVGNALASNPFPIIIPCHRAIRSDMTIGGYQGGPMMKRALLEAEGNSFDGRMRILEPKIHY